MLKEIFDSGIIPVFCHFFLKKRKNQQQQDEKYFKSDLIHVNYCYKACPNEQHVALLITLNIEIHGEQAYQ